VDDLLQRLNDANLTDDDNFLDAKDCQGLHRARMFNIDDFGMITPTELCLISRIWPEKVSVIFTFVKDMLDEVHAEKQEYIVEMESYLMNK
jgi:hypothetical protein